MIKVVASKPEKTRPPALAGDDGLSPRPICPACHGVLAREAELLHCEACCKDYPVIADIADLRLAPDPWIGVAEDRAKGIRLEAEAGPGFEAAVRAYWSITPESTDADAARHIDHVLGGTDRSREWISHLHPAPTAGEKWLDLGCGTADLACAAPPGVRVTGIDIAYRWLVVARRRLNEAHRDDELFCGNAEALPFADQSFDRVVALGTIEHCADLDSLLREAKRVLRPGGRLHIRTTNRHSLLPEPHVGMWGVAWLPRTWADRYVRWRGGRGFLHHFPRGALAISQALRRTGFVKVRTGAARMLASEEHRMSAAFRPVIPLYDMMRGVPMLNLMIRTVSPLLDAEGVAP